MNVKPGNLLVAILLLLSLARNDAAGQERTTVEPQEGDRTGRVNRLNEIVAVGRGQGLLTLATPTDGNRVWRYRTVLLHPAGAEVRRASLSRSGTKVLLEFSNQRKVVDLSRPAYSVSESDPESAPSHRLLRQPFPTIQAGRLVVLDDLGQVRGDYETIEDVLAAAAHDDGTILYATTAGALFLYDPVRETRTELDFRLPPGTPSSDVHILGGSLTEPHRFLLVLDKGGQSSIVDPIGGASLGDPKDPTTALLEAELLLGFGRDHGASEKEIAALASLLVERQDPAQLALPQARGGVPPMEWSFFHVIPDVSLYAPILEFGSQERVFPSSVFIWDELEDALDVSPARASDEEALDAYFRAYLRLGDERKKRCSLYERVSSYSGSWLIEYWIYSPFDVGGLEPHPHDSEHLFVEVDKLGGTVAALFGGAHGMLAPNNTYLILDDKGYPLELPLFAMVELGKHATAPDVNRDGFFTPGLDENYFQESAKVWGIRDAFGTKDSHFLLYDGSMMAPRLREHWLGVKDADRIFPEVEIANEQCLCEIQSFRAKIEKGLFQHPTSQVAADTLRYHKDAQDARTIFKPWVFPRSFLRVGAGKDREAQFPAVQVAYVTDLDRVPYLSILPGRLAFELSYTPLAKERLETMPDGKVSAFHVRRLDYGIRYERLVSNLFGFYAGLHKGNEIVRSEASGSTDFVSQDGLWFSVGPMAEIPLWSTNFLFQAGAAFREGTSPIFEFRFAFGVYQKPRWFWGIAEKQKSPY
jgi:hypothetical protein